MSLRPGWLLLALLLAGCVRDLPRDASAATIELTRAEAVRSDEDAVVPPAGGWTPVELVDYWDQRWPGHDGVVWYRLRWQQRDASRSAGLLVNYMSMTGAVYVNGSLVGRAPRLVEPLSRTWVAPDYFLLSPPLLREGENTLLLRVSGRSDYQPGAGTVVVGDPAAVRAQYRNERFRRHDIKLVNVAMSAVLGVLFLMMWLLRRQDTVYGWFALSELTGALYGANFIAASTWPFPTTDGWAAFNAAMWVVSGAGYTMFLLRFGERRYPRIERAMWMVSVAALAAALLAPGWMGPHRTPWILAGVVFFYAGVLWFMRHALRQRRVEYLVLAGCLVIPVLVSIHDLGAYLGWVHADTFLGSLTSVVSLVGIAFVVSYRFVNAMRRVEGFNAELQREVAAATSELASTLNRQHALELSHSRAGERLQLVRDLHDGFGGTLVGAISRLEQAPDGMPGTQVVSLLKDMRDDLRLVIDTTAQEHADLAMLLAPLRHRATSLLEAGGIDAHWQVQGLDGLHLGPGRSLDLLRLLQEALTNVFKHSRARRVDVRVMRVDEVLEVQVRDDGRGLSADVAPGSLDGAGAGLASMRLRAQRLGAQLHLAAAAAGGTELRLELPLAA
ncbi:MAG: ATP-binding protein [Luteimonas sp.]|nr:ATP-binding protein [Luteimonas sp.]